MHEAISEAWQDLSPSIAEFLLDRIEGQEGVAHREPNDHRSAAVLAEAKAKRRIVHEWRLAKAKADSGDLSGQIASIGLSIAMKALVQPYAGRPDAPSYASYPDFRPEWRLEPLDD